MKGMIRSLCIAAGASALALPLAAVGTAAGASAQGSTQPLVLWEGSNVEAQNAVILKAFQAKTGIKVSTLIFPTGDAGYQDTLTKWAAGTRPDLLQWFGIGNYVAVLNPTQTLVPLTNMPFVKKTPASYLDNTVKYDGQIWAAMLDTPVLDTVSYNRNIFTQLKLEHSAEFQPAGQRKPDDQAEGSIGGPDRRWLRRPLARPDPCLHDVEFVPAEQLRPHHGWYQ